MKKKVFLNNAFFLCALFFTVTLPAQFATEVSTVSKNPVILLAKNLLNSEKSIQGDNLAPVAKARDITVFVDENCSVSILNNATDDGSYDPEGEPLTYSLSSNGPFTVGMWSVTMTVTDPSGKRDSATTQITVVDNIAPIAITKDIIVLLDANGRAVVVPENINNGSSDNCGINMNLAISQSDFDCTHIGTNRVTLTVTDDHGNSATSAAIVTIEDNIAPVAITKDFIVQLDANGSASVVPADINNGSLDNCGIASVAFAGSGVLKATALEHYDLILQAPEGTVFDDIIFASYGTPADNDEGFAIGNCHATNSVSIVKGFALGKNYAKIPAENSIFGDPCRGTYKRLYVTATYRAESLTKDFTCANVGPNEVSLVVTDVNGNKSTETAIVTVEDNISRIATAKDTTIELDVNGVASIVASDIVDGSNDFCNVTLALSQSNFDCTHIGANTVTLTVTDDNGNSTSSNAIVTVEDNIAPVAIAKDIAIQLDENGVASIAISDIDNGSNDACEVTLAISQSDFDCTHIGANTVTLTATDNNGNSTTSAAIVTVEDHIAPVAITKDFIVQLDANGSASVVPADINNGSLDNCGIASVAFAGSVGTLKASALENYDLILQAPEGSVIEDIIFASYGTPADNDEGFAIGNCHATNSVSIVRGFALGKNYVKIPAKNSIFGDPCRGTYKRLYVTATYRSESLTKDFTCANVGPNEVSLVVTDVSGNKSTETATITIEDNTRLAIAKDITIELDVNGVASIVASDIVNGSSDFCKVTLAVSQSDFDFTHVGANTVILTVTDTNGNSTYNEVVVTVIDVIAPKAIAQDITITLDEFGDATITPEDVDNESFDNCSFTASLDVTTFDCTNIGRDNLVTLTVTDASGNTDSTTATVRILEHFNEKFDLRSLASFEAFTGAGDVTNSGTFTGNVGTNVGGLTGFSGSNFKGTAHFNDALTVQAELDLLKAYIHLNNIFVTHPGTHAPSFGSGETLSPGVYSIGGAGSLAGKLTLDGGGDSNALFILKFKGAFTAGAGSNIVLINGAKAANVFWVAQGALSVGASSVIKGTLLAYPGAITLGVNSSIEGRLISSVGAITIGDGATATMPGAMNIPINPMISYIPAAAVDVLGSIEKFRLFTSNGAVSNASTSGIIGDIGADVGDITGFSTSAHIGSFYNANAVTAQAKIDLNNAYNQLMLIPTTVSNHTPAFGSGEILEPGVYAIPGAGSLAGVITLNGGGNKDAVFILKFNGAFAAGAQSKVILSNGTRRCNVFWISEGAASIGASSTLKGTILAHGGAATMGAGGNLEGRLLSTGGAIGFSTGVIYTVVHDVECDPNTKQRTSANDKTLANRVEALVSDSLEEALAIYPNPSRGVFNIKLKTFNVQTEIYLFDTTGKLIARKTISKEGNSGNTIAIGNKNLSSGIYLVKIMTKNETVTKKVIVETSN